MAVLLPIETIFEDYVAGLEGPFKPKTCIHKTSHIRQFVRWMQQQDMSLAGLNVQALNRYLSYRRNECRACTTTLYHDQTQVRIFLRYCRSMGYMDSNPCTDWGKVKKPPHKDVIVPDDDTVACLLASIKKRWDIKENPKARFASQEYRTFLSRRDYALLLLVVETGCRNGEATGLRLADVCVDKKSLTESDWSAIRKMKLVEIKKSPIMADVTFRDTKTARDRTVPVTLSWLRAASEWLVVRPRATTSPCLFVTMNDKAVDPSWFTEKLKDYTTFANLPNITPQKLRQYRLSKMANRNILVASVLGGNSIKVLREHYVEPDRALAREVWEATLENDATSTKQPTNSRKRLL